MNKIILGIILYTLIEGVAEMMTNYNYENNSDFQKSFLGINRNKRRLVIQFLTIKNHFGLILTPLVLYILIVLVNKAYVLLPIPFIVLVLFTINDKYNYTKYTQILIPIFGGYIINQVVLGLIITILLYLLLLYKIEDKIKQRIIENKFILLIIIMIILIILRFTLDSKIINFLINGIVLAYMIYESTIISLFFEENKKEVTISKNKIRLMALTNQKPSLKFINKKIIDKQIKVNSVILLLIIIVFTVSKLYGVSLLMVLILTNLSTIDKLIYHTITDRSLFYQNPAVRLILENIAFEYAMIIFFLSALISRTTDNLIDDELIQRALAIQEYSMYLFIIWLIIGFIIILIYFYRFKKAFKLQANY